MTRFVLSLAVALLTATAGVVATPYRLAATVPLGAPDKWDYAVYDPEDGRLYVAHSDRLDVVDGARARVIGSVLGVPGGTHGTAVVHAVGKGFTDDGLSGTAVAFDLGTMKVTRTIPADQDADAVAYEPRSGHVFVIEGDPAKITVIDPRTEQPVATIQAGEKMEYAVAGDGLLYVAGEQNGVVVFQIDVEEVRLDIMRRADGPGDDGLVAFEVQMRNVFYFDGAHTDEFVDVGVIYRELHACAVLQHVGTAVADVADKQLIALHGCAYERGAHAFAFGILRSADG